MNQSRANKLFLFLLLPVVVVVVTRLDAFATVRVTNAPAYAFALGTFAARISLFLSSFHEPQGLAQGRRRWNGTQSSFIFGRPKLQRMLWSKAKEGDEDTELHD